MKRRAFVGKLAALPIVGAFFGMVIVTDKSLPEGAFRLGRQNGKQRMTAAEVERLVTSRNRERRHWDEMLHATQLLQPNLPCGGKRVAIRHGLPVSYRAMNEGITLSRPTVMQVDIPREVFEDMRHQLRDASPREIRAAFTAYWEGTRA